MSKAFSFSTVVSSYFHLRPQKFKIYSHVPKSRSKVEKFHHSCVEMEKRRCTNFNIERACEVVTAL